MPMSIPQQALDQMLATGTMPCHIHHPYDCLTRGLISLLRTVLSISRVYLPVHLLPFLFKLRNIKQRPGFSKLFKQFMLGFIRSLLFGGVYVAIVQLGSCYTKPLHDMKTTGTFNPLISALIAGLALLF